MSANVAGTENLEAWDVIIIGAGAAGLMCAISAGARGRRVLLLDHAASVGRKILMSGGGRCNFTNLQVEAENFISENPHFCKSALSRYRPEDFIGLVERYRIPYYEKELGKLYCRKSSKDILALLLSECRAVGVTPRAGVSVSDVQKRDEGWAVTCSAGRYSASSLVIATGGLSIPSAGATGFGYELAQRFGHSIVPTRPGLVPLTWSAEDRARFTELSGLSTSVDVQSESKSFRHDMLFTHRGLSGPAILQISNYWREGQDLKIDLAPGEDLAAWLEEKRRSRSEARLSTVIGERIPRRLATLLIPGTETLGQCQARRLSSLLESLKGWRIRPAGSEGYRTAEVTLGGVDTKEISSKTFESRKAPGLFFVGEVLDVTGQLGGYNFQWAWASGHCAGEWV